MKANLEQVNKRMRQAAVGCGRDGDRIRLVAVSKTQAVQTVKAAIDAGATILGENYIQEARTKFEALATETVQWHFIGHLQRNKAKYAVRIFDLIHSVDSLRLAREIDKQAAKHGKVQPVLIQVNISQETTKSGTSEADALTLIREAAGLGHLAIQGLMTMPPYFNAPEKVRPYFAALRKLAQRIQGEHIPGVSMAELSMGMTGDFETAIEEGATLIRVGTAIFGERH